MKHCVTEWAEVTPDTVAGWLKRHYYTDVQRAIRPVHVKRLAELHARNELDGRAITFVFGVITSTVHNLLNGYHTCYAIQRVNKPLMANVQYAMCEDEKDMRRLYAVHDTNMKRGIVDALRATGVSIKIPNAASAGFGGAIKMIVGNFEGSMAMGPDAFIPGLLSTTDTAEDWLVEMTTYLKHIKEVDQKRMMTWLYSASSIAMGLITIRHQPEKAAIFWNMLATGVSNNSTHPCKRLYDYILAREASGHAYVAPHRRLKLMSKAWNAFYAGETLAPMSIKHIPSLFCVAGTPYDKYPYKIV